MQLWVLYFDYHQSKNFPYHLEMRFSVARWMKKKQQRTISISRVIFSKYSWSTEKNLGCSIFQIHKNISNILYKFLIINSHISCHITLITALMLLFVMHWIKVARYFLYLLIEYLKTYQVVCGKNNIIFNKIWVIEAHGAFE